MRHPLLDKLKTSNKTPKEPKANRLSRLFSRIRRKKSSHPSRDPEKQQPPGLLLPPLSDPEFEQLENEIKQLREVEKSFNETIKGLDVEIEVVEKRLNKREGQRDELEGITKELAIAQRFLSTADSLSQAEVVRDMESLNEEIFQLTSILAEKVQVAERHLQEDPERIEMFRERVMRFGKLGLFLEVVESKHLEDVTAIQIGWQAILVYWCSEIIQAWVVEDEELNERFGEVYKGVISEYEQAVAGRWRAIAYGVFDDVSQDTRKKLKVDLIRAMVALPVLCGYISSQKSHNDLCKEFEQRMAPLIDKCLKFRKTVGEGITSTNIRPYFCASGDIYNPEYADLEYEDDDPEEEGGGGQQQLDNVIACPFGLGLRCTQTSRNEEGRYVESSEPILKPKVILQRTLQEIIA